MHVFVVGCAQQHEASVVFEALVSRFGHGDRLAAERFDGVDVEVGDLHRDCWREGGLVGEVGMEVLGVWVRWMNGGKEGVSGVWLDRAEHV